MRRLVIALLLLAACGDSGSATTTTSSIGPFPADAFAYPASSDLAVGTDRLLVAVSDPAGTRLPRPDIPVTITVSLQGGGEQQTVAAGFIWAIPDVSGLYRASFDFDEPGVWLVTVQPASGPALPDFPISVQESPMTVAVGEPAPQSETFTIHDHAIAEITSDDDPDPSLYQMTIAEAVTSGRPSVIAFATPRFCQTAICGPTLERIIEIKADFPDVNFIHVEVFTNLDDPENIEIVPAVTEWGLPTEPWVFVVDAAGIVVARFEGVVDPAEIAAALAA